MTLRRPAHHALVVTAAAAAAALLAAGAPALAGAVEVRGSFAAEVQRMKSLAFGNESGLYVAPTPAQRDAFHALAAGLWAGQHLTPAGAAAVQAQAGALGYELVRFHDIDTGHAYHGLREQLNAQGRQTRGWGTYYMHSAAITDATAQSPHVLHDINTEEMGGKVFQRAAARGYLLAGAHRNVNGFGTGDVCRDADCAYHQVHKAWSGPTGQTTGWQIHGFVISGYPNWPETTDAVLSTGGGGVSDQMLDLDARLEAAGWETYAYNTLSPTDSRNVSINGGLSGTTFSGLGATGNLQGQHSRGIGGTFVHVELEQSIRFNSANRDSVSTIVARSMARTDEWATGFKRWDGGAGTASAGAWNAANNWSANGLPGAGDVVVFDLNHAAALPSMTLSAGSLTVRGVVWNASASSELAALSASGGDSILHLAGDPANPDRPLLATYPLAESGTFTLANTNAAGGAGRLKVNLLNGGGVVNVASAGAALRIDAQVTESTPGARLTKTGPGLLILTNTTNAFTGGVTIAGGTLQAAGFTQLGPAPSTAVADFITLDGGTFRYSGSGINISNSRGIRVSENAGTIEVRTSTATLGLGSPLSGPGELNKVGPGTLTIGRANPDFTGTLVVREGVLVPTSDGALGAASAGTSVRSGATLGLRGGIDHTTAEAIEIEGTGAGGNGALWNIADANTLAGPVTLAASAAVRAAAGSKLTLAGGVSGGNSATLTVTGGGEVEALRVRTGGLSVGPGTTLRVLAGRSPAGTSVLRSLAVDASGRLDVSDQDLVVDYAGASPFNAVRSLIVSGYAGGTWGGPGVSSSAAASAGDTAVGYALSTDVFTSFPASFSAQAVDSTAVLLRYTLSGDATLDGAVTIADFSRLAAAFNAPGNWGAGDFDYDGTVGIADFARLAANFNRTMPAATPARPVPEPTSAGLLLAVAAFVRRRGRQR